MDRKICGVYVRNSLNNLDSIRKQIKIGTEFCNSNNFNFEYYNENGNDSKILRKLLSDIESCKINIVWVLNLKRLSGESMSLTAILKRFRISNIALYVNDSIFDFNNYCISASAISAPYELEISADNDADFCVYNGGRD